MLHEKPVQCDTLGDDEEGTRPACMGAKRRKYLATVQDHQDLISKATDTDAIIQLGMQDHDLLTRSEDSGQQDKDGHKEEEEDQLYGPAVDINAEEVISYRNRLAPNIRLTDLTRLEYLYSDMQGFDKLQERLARYRITYYKIANPESSRELKDPHKYSSDELGKESYFVRLEDDDSFEWHFHPDAIWIIGLDDYQRFVPSYYAHDSRGPAYCFWYKYRKRYHTYEIDDDYVRYYGELSKKINWIECFFHLDPRSNEMFKFTRRAVHQATKLATKFRHMTIDLVHFAYDELIRDLRMDAAVRDLSLVYFEIWKLVAKKNVGFRKAVEESRGLMDKFPLHKKSLENLMDINVNNEELTIEHMFQAIGLKGSISLNAGEDEARNAFTSVVDDEFRLENMAAYARKKLEIAQLLGMCSRQS